jgi:uncharacterized protein DUF5985
MMASIIYTLCALTCLACAFLLLRGYRQTRAPLLLWSGLCFVGLTLSNMLLVVDRVLTGPETDFSTGRLAVAFFALLLLLFGLIWEHD